MGLYLNKIRANYKKLEDKERLGLKN